MEFYTLIISFYFFYILYASGINVTLNKISSIRIPHSYGSIEYQLDDYDANAITYDTEEKIMYCVGEYTQKYIIYTLNCVYPELHLPLRTIPVRHHINKKDSSLQRIS